jgi:hypothetical protein
VLLGIGRASGSPAVAIDRELHRVVAGAEGHTVLADQQRRLLRSETFIAVRVRHRYQVLWQQCGSFITYANCWFAEEFLNFPRALHLQLLAELDDLLTSLPFGGR